MESISENSEVLLPSIQIMTRSEFGNFSSQVLQVESIDQPVRRISKQILGPGLSRNTSVKVTLTDLDYNAPSLDYLSSLSSFNRIAAIRLPDDKTSSATKVRIGSATRGSVLLVPDNFDASSAALTQSYLYPLEDIEPVPERNRDIEFKELGSLEHLVYGSNSSICSARLKKEGQVIVKIIKDKVINREVAEAEFEEEHKILCRLSHPHIMGYFGKGYMESFKGRREFLVLERMEAGTLNGILHHPGYFTKAKPLSEGRVLEVALEFADALTYMHEGFHPDACLIHRDLKPDNIAFTSQGVLKLIDFGLTACVRKKTEINETYAMTGNTGSLRYMAPEVCMCVPYNEKVDIYGYGIIMWQTASSIRPFEDMSSHIDFVNRVASGGERPPLPSADPELRFPAGLADIISECWEGDYRLRPSAAQVYDRVRVLIERSTKEGKSSSEQTSSSCTVS